MDTIQYTKTVTGGISMLGARGESHRRYARFSRVLCPICYADILSEDNAGLGFKLFLLTIISGVLVYYSILYDSIVMFEMGGFAIIIIALPMIFRYRGIRKAKSRSNELRNTINS
ncbi:MAG: hypothetical protein ACXAD7_06070 [Candidatus Kariarchaeaceae archaeon]|jgi:hypothetical protein